jgi:hypothetical protein
VSNEPVGSSASIISGLITIALAIATLCCSHQDNSFGLLYNLSLSHTLIKAFLALVSLSILDIP